MTAEKSLPQTITLQDIAERCGVTKATVSRALNGHPRIGEATIARIQALADEMGYNPTTNDAARRLSLKRSGRQVINHVIALFWPPHTYQSAYFGPIYQHLLEELTELDFAMLTLYFREANAAPTSMPRVFERGDVDGAIIFGRHWGRYGVAERLTTCAGFARRPIVTILETLAEHSAVLADEAGGTRAAVEALLAQGHRHFVQCIYQPLWPGQTEPYSRVEAVRDALTTAGLDPATHLHLLEIPAHWSEGLDVTYLASAANAALITALLAQVSATVLPFLQARPDVTAILALNDPLAANLWYALQQAGYRIPDDFSIVGFDDTTPVLGDAGENQLASVQLPLQRIGQETARLIVAQITAADTTSQQLVLPTHLIARASLGPAR
jgi:DNA-binding LacI/PurR family transcriptional regulator